jgi:spermidine synthase
MPTARLQPCLVDDRREMTNGEKVLVTRHSAFQAIRLTENAAGLRTLRFGDDGPSQSIVKVGDARHLELPYARVLPACLAFTQNPRRILIVGLGGGTLPRFLHSHFPEMMIDVVELDPEVVALAKEYCGFEEDSRLRVTVNDGRDFIEASSGGYDVIILDSFDTDSIPTHLTTRESGSVVRNALAPEGIAVANVWGRATNPLYASMLLTYRAAFEDVYIFDVPAPGTKLFVASRRRQQMTRDELIQKVREISRLHEFGYDLAGAISGFRNSDLETVRGGSVLRD